MRPGGLANADALPTSARKPSFGSTNPPSNPRSTVPTSFFLARESEIDSRTDPPDTPVPSAVCTLEEAISGAFATSDNTHEETDPSIQRRRSTIIPDGNQSARSHSIQSLSHHATSVPLTPTLLPTAGDTSLPSSPKSISSRSLHIADEASLSDDVASQAVLSSGEEDEPEPTSEAQDSAPQLIMPSIRMPSRRPFTTRGRELGRLKIMVAGSKGSGKTSLIKSIVQLCEDIVHVDPLESASSTPAASKVLRTSTSGQSRLNEIYASTKPYPSWWSEIDESRVLRRRKSLGDAVLERNICFVDTTSTTKVEQLIQYMERQLQLAVATSSSASTDFLHLLSGSGGPQVDIILFLVLKDTLSQDLDMIQRLSDVGNVVPLIAKGDCIADDDISQLKADISNALSSPVIQPFKFLHSGDEDDNQPPYAVSAAISPDSDNMDASLLMSSEYIQPLVQSQLPLLVKKIFDKDSIAYLRHTAAKKLISWRTRHPIPVEIAPSPRSASPRPSTIGSPAFSSTSASGVLVPYASDNISLTTSNSYTLARIADHTQREERLAHVRLAKWATDLQQSLNRERERYERLARGDRALWLVERMNEEVRDGRLQAISHSPSRNRSPATGPNPTTFPLQDFARSAYATNDPLGVLKWNDDIKTRGWVALQVVGSFGVIGGLAVWLAKIWGFNSYPSSTPSITEHVSALPWKW